MVLLWRVTVIGTWVFLFSRNVYVLLVVLLLLLLLYSFIHGVTVIPMCLFLARNCFWCVCHHHWR